MKEIHEVKTIQEIQTEICGIIRDLAAEGIPATCTAIEESWSLDGDAGEVMGLGIGESLWYPEGDIWHLTVKGRLMADGMTTKFAGISLAELHTIIAPVDRSPTECDGCTRAISHLFTERGITHDGLVGKLYTPDGVLPHFRIELLDDRGMPWIIDLRLRIWWQKWLGKHPIVPHGIFRPDMDLWVKDTSNNPMPAFQPEWRHVGGFGMLHPAVLAVLTEGKIL